MFMAMKVVTVSCKSVVCMLPLKSLEESISWL